MKSHGEILKEIMKEKDIKVPDLAKKIGVPASSIYSILSRDGTGTRKTLLEKISVALNVPIEVFTQTVSMTDYSNGLGILKKIDKDSFYKYLNARNKDITYVSNILCIFGYSEYTPNYLASVIENSTELDPDLANLIWQITTKESLLNVNDLLLINRLHSLYQLDSQLVENIIARLCNLTEAQKEYFKMIDKHLD